MPARDLLSLIRTLPADSALSRHELGDLAGWDMHRENTALLVEAMRYWLDVDWAGRTTDPDDPQVVRDRAEARRAGIRPPSHPIIPPIAHRPESLAAQRAAEYERLLRQQRPSTKRLVSSDEFDQLLGL
jgi:hypothetical protein